MKIGVLVFSRPDRIRVGRDGRSDYSFDGLGLRGLQSVITNCTYKVLPCSSNEIDNFDAVLVTLTSYHDVLNLVAHVPLKRKALIVVGGPACSNLNPLLDSIDIANFGRCDGSKINRILSGEKMPSVWRKTDDSEFEKEYTVDGGDVTGLGINEFSYGCRQKCAFCFYSWWNKHTSNQSGQEYSSGFADHEDFIQSLDWHKCIRGGVTAIDGCTEETRLRVGKLIRSDDIRCSLLKSNLVNTSVLLRCKIYGIVGYPWEGQKEFEKFDLPVVAQALDHNLKNNVLIRMHWSHFIPFQKTPLWFAKFNWNDYRGWCLKNRVLFSGRKIKILSGGTFMGSASMAAESCIVQRASRKDVSLLKIFYSAKWRSSSSEIKRAWLKTNCDKILDEQTKDLLINVKTPNEKILKVAAEKQRRLIHA
jgi:hypothetical protein